MTLQTSSGSDTEPEKELYKAVFKQEYIPELRKEVFAFANAEGGTGLIDVHKNGVIVGEGTHGRCNVAGCQFIERCNSTGYHAICICKMYHDREQAGCRGRCFRRNNLSILYKGKEFRSGNDYVRKGSSSQPMTDESVEQ